MSDSHALVAGIRQSRIWRFRLHLPGKQNRVFYGFWLRIVFTTVSVFTSAVMITAIGAFNHWVLNDLLLAIYSISMFALILLGEHLRVRTYERVLLDTGSPKIDIELRSGGASIAIAMNSGVNASKIYYDGLQTSSRVRFRSKRILDLSAVIPSLFLLAPVLIIIALFVKFDSPGPILFRQRRVGFNGKAFVIYKFRTMSVLEDGDVVIQARRGDARVTRVGRILRRTGFDELPQLYNVLKGDMSLVGPRPHTIAHDVEYRRLIDSYHIRYQVKPGLVGLSQLSGLRGEGDVLENMRQRTSLDIWYLENWSLWLDLNLLMRTFLAVGVSHSTY